MPSVLVRPRARTDLSEIWAYIAADSVRRADAFIDQCTAQFDLLAGQPAHGRARDELQASLRSFPFQRYVIFYIPSTSGIEVVRVLHGAQDVESQF